MLNDEYIAKTLQAYVDAVSGDDVEAIIEKVHADIFNSRAQLDVNFRRDFIEIFYG